MANRPRRPHLPELDGLELPRLLPGEPELPEPDGPRWKLRHYGPDGALITVDEWVSLASDNSALRQSRSFRRDGFTVDVAVAWHGLATMVDEQANNWAVSIYYLTFFRHDDGYVEDIWEPLPYSWHFASQGAAQAGFTAVCARMDEHAKTVAQQWKP